MSWWRKLFGVTEPVRVIDVQSYGPRLTLEEVEILLRQHPEAMRAVMQVCVFQRDLCQRAVEDKSNVLHGQTAFEAGAAAGMTDLMTTLERIQRGVTGGDPQLKAWFRQSSQ